MTRAPRLILAGVALAGTALWSATLAQSHLTARASVLDRLESSLLDLRILGFGPRSAPGGVLIVAIDDETLRWAGAFPLPRGRLAEAVDRLAAAGVKAIAIDALFLDPAAPDQDEALARALAGRPTVLAAMLDYPAGAPAAPPACLRPLPALRRVAATGTANIALDRSGIARHVPLLLSCGPGLLPALPLRAAALAAQDEPAFGVDAVTLGAITTPLDVGRHLALRYYGPEGTIATVGLAAVAKGEVPAETLRGRTVVIGATAHGVGDRYPTPFDTVLPGVEIMATAIANLETGDALDRTSWVRRVDAGTTVLLALAVVGALLVERIGLGLLTGTALLAAWLAMVLVGFAHGVWLAMAIPLAALLPTAALTAAGRLGLDRWTERRLRRQHGALAGFQSPAMLARLDADPGFLAQPVEREIATVFIDLSGFTGLSERLGPRVARDLLKQWHEIVEDGATAGGGFAASYMADGAMLVWGLTDAAPDDAARAVRTAVLLERGTLAWLRAVEPQTGPLGVKVGGHVGPAVVSRLGHVRHQHITAIGDSVNVASRLMEVAAERGATVAVSAALLALARRQGLSETEIAFQPPESLPIRGRAQAVLVCLLTPDAEPAKPSSPAATASARPSSPAPNPG